MSTRKPKKPKRLFSDLKVARDANGRLRIGGRFASQATVNKLQGARKRRGVAPARVYKSTPKPTRKSVGKTKASRASQKAAVTRKLNNAEVSRREYITPRARYHNVEYLLPEIDTDLIRLAIEREQIGNERLLAYTKIRGITGDGDEVVIGTRMIIVPKNSEEITAQRLADMMDDIAAQYLIESVLDIMLYISRGRGDE